MYRSPSINTLVKNFRITIEEAKIIRKLIKGKIDALSYKQVKDWYNQCYNVPSSYMLILKALNVVLEMFDIEILEKNKKTWYYYLNSGDTYNATIFFNKQTNTFFVSSIGDIME